MMKKWIGSTEEYRFTDAVNNTTNLKIFFKKDEAFQQMFDDSWPKALKLLKQLCEAKL